MYIKQNKLRHRRVIYMTFSSDHLIYFIPGPNNVCMIRLISYGMNYSFRVYLVNDKQPVSDGDQSS